MNKTFVVCIAFYSEPNYRGNCTIYFLKHIHGKNIAMCNIGGAKHYESRYWAERAVEKVKQHFPTAEVTIDEWTFEQRLNRKK